MADESLALKDVPRTEPSTTTGLVSDGASLFRQIKKALWPYVTRQHNEDGYHFYGDDIGGLNAIICQVGQADQLQSDQLYAGLAAKCKIGATTTNAAVTFRLKSDTTFIGAAIAVKYNNSTTLPIGLLVVNTIVEFVYDGTNWTVASGFSASAGGAPGAAVDASYDNTGFSEINDTTDETEIGSISLPANSYSFVDIDIEIYQRSNTFAEAHTCIIRFKEGATTRRTTAAFRMIGEGGAYVQLSHRITGGQGSPATISITAEMSIANPNDGVTLVWIKLTGVH